MELSIPYVLVGPDGTRAVFGNTDAAFTDPDYVGYIDPDNGIAGLDGADPRATVDNLAEQDGGIIGDAYDSPRGVVINLVLNPNLAGGAATASLERKVKRACRAMTADASLKWTPSDIGLELELKLRRTGKPTIAGRRPKTAQLTMTAADPVKRASAESQLVLVPGAAAGLIGYTSPFDSPYGTALGETGQTFVVNQGDVEAIPRLRIDGPITNPEVLNVTSGKRLKLAYTLSAGEWLDVDFGRKTVLLGGTVSRFAAVVFPDSKWWRLAPGSNDIRLLAANYSAGAQVTVYWRHAYE